MSNAERRRSWREQRYRKQLFAIRRSVPYRFWRILQRAKASPYRLLILPGTLFRFARRIARQKRHGAGKRSEAVTAISSPRSSDAVVFLPTNGAGLGHLSRTLAVAVELRDLSPSTEIVFFCTAPVTPLVEKLGFIAYQIPGRRYIAESLDYSEWNLLAGEHLSLVLDFHDPRAFVFDGTLPYAGILSALEGRKAMSKVWIRRRNFKRNVPTLDEYESGFDRVVLPGDAVEEIRDDTRSTKAMHCDPVVLAPPGGYVSRGEVRRELDLPPDAVVAYVQLGAGEINEIEALVRRIVHTVLAEEGTMVVLGESPLGKTLGIYGGRVRKIRDYPNSIYFQGFDFAVIAAGYNSYHEVIAARLPAVCIPNRRTVSDNQVARANAGRDAGIMLVPGSDSEEEVAVLVRQMLRDDNREALRRKLEGVSRPGGASAVAGFLAQCRGPAGESPQVSHPPEAEGGAFH